MKTHSENELIRLSWYSHTWYYSTEYLVMTIITVVMVSITAGSHSIGLPLYKLNPMHWVIYFTILLRKPSVSAIVILAFLLPLTSNLLTGHPLMIKSVIMGVELLIYGMIFRLAIKYFNMVLVLAYILSQIAGYIVYYGLKFTFIRIGLINGALVSTSVILQVVVFGLLGTALFCTDRFLLARNHRQ